ncbi:MAG: M14 family zinc carboxypeptidase [Actinomycetota bacterium]
MQRRIVALVGACLLLAASFVAVTSRESVATPAATDENQYSVMGRAFPDPHGCVKGAPAKSPWAKGNVCAAQFIQWDEAIGGLKFLEQRFPRYLQVINLKTQFGDHPELLDEELQSAGLPREDLTRDKRDLYAIKVTDRNSPVPEADRKHFAYSLSIHGIERAGIEGGIRAVEDLVTWAACEESPDAAPACASEGPFPKPILEPSNSGPTAGQVLTNGVVYFVLSNPDGWHRGEVTKGGAFFQRYNGNGMDVNRDWPTIGYTEGQYTPASEPETQGYASYLQLVKEQTTAGKFDAAIDLHGMLTAPSFSFTLLGAGQRDYRKNALSVDTSIKTFRDSEERLAWSPLIAPADSCPGATEVPGLGGNIPMCSDQWGTVWDTINYQVTGSFGDWMDSPLGLDGIGIDNEMALSHLTPNTHFDPDIEQLHVDGNKGLIYAQIASLLEDRQVQFKPGGKVAYVFDPDRVTNPGGGPADGAPNNLPTQDDITTTQATGLQEFRFDVKGPSDGVFNGGMTIEANFGNLGSISPNSAAELVLEYCGPPDHAGDEEGCREVAHYFNQSPLYLQAGARIDLNDPKPGPYRIRPEAGRLLPTRFDVSFSRASAYEVPDQAPYDVSRMDFFEDLNEYTAPEDQLTRVTVDSVLRRGRSAIKAYDSLVVSEDFMPGFVADDGAPEPTGTPQSSESFSLTPAAAPLPTTSGIYEFDVQEGFDNDRMTVTATWGLPSDYDIHVERLDPVTNAWQDRGCECSFVNNGEEVTVFAPEPGSWRVRVENFLAAPQQVDGEIEFATDPAPPAAPDSRYTPRQFKRYAGAIAEFAGRGGNVVLTDGAIQGLSALATGITADQITSGSFYAGWMDFDDGRGATYDVHPLAEDVNKEGTAEGRSTVDGQSFEHRHQTYEPVPLGYYVSPAGAGNSECDSDRCDSPNWIVDQQAWQDAGGTTAARTLVRETVSPGSSSTTGTSLGELDYGAGRIRIAGALLPDPTEQNYHPYGLASYALTYTGYQLFENLVDWTPRFRN